MDHGKEPLREWPVPVGCGGMHARGMGASRILQEGALALVTGLSLVDEPLSVQGTALRISHPVARMLPADVVFPAGVQRRQAVGLLLGLIGAGRNDGLPPAFGTGCVIAGAEEQLVGVLGWHTVEELAQGFVAFGAVAGVGPGQAPDAE